MGQADKDPLPSMNLHCRHTITTLWNLRPANTEEGQAFRNMTHEERLEEVDRINNPSDEVSDVRENVHEAQKATKAKKSDKEKADDTNDDDEDYEGEESDDEEEDKTPVKKHPAVSKLGRGRPHKSFSPTGSPFSNDYLNDYLNDYSTFYLCSRRKFGVRFPAVVE